MSIPLQCEVHHRIVDHSNKLGNAWTLSFRSKWLPVLQFEFRSTFSGFSLFASQPISQRWDQIVVGQLEVRSMKREV